MVLLAMDPENNPHARVAIITDRDELNRSRVARARDDRTGTDLMTAGPPLPALIHKFGGVDDSSFIKELEPPPWRSLVFVTNATARRAASSGV